MPINHVLKILKNSIKQFVNFSLFYFLDQLFNFNVFFMNFRYLFCNENGFLLTLHHDQRQMVEDQHPVG